MNCLTGRVRARQQKGKKLEKNGELSWAGSFSTDYADWYTLAAHNVVDFSKPW